MTTTSVREHSARPHGRGRLWLRFSCIGARLRARARAVTGGVDRERGDVPGWVLVTLMTAGLVITLWAVASPLLAKVFDESITSVTGPGSH